MANNNIDKNGLPLDDEWVARLMEGKLSKEEEDMLVSNIENSDMLADAMEGLEQYSSINQAQKQSHEINQQLLEQLKSKRTTKKHQPMSMTTIVWITLILVIVLVLLGFYLIRTKGL
ncbi:MAG TPA: hypothetical protein VGB84_04350 [Arachidicoccus sp.]